MTALDFDGSSRASAQVSASTYLSAAAYWVPEHLIASAWLEHAPFGFWLVEATRPGTIVELGTHRGFSFFTFCDAVTRLQLTTRAFAVDTWAGDDHAGSYGEDIYEYVRNVVSRDYSAFATMCRGYFDEKVDNFEGGSIDLLHIDGRHAYADVRHDFETWIPKVSDRGVVLFHDVAERREGFGVWRFWEEIRTEYPSFTFEHAHGLGLLGVGPELPTALHLLFEADAPTAETVREDYMALGARVANIARLVATSNEIAEVRRLLESATLRNEQLEAVVEEMRTSTSWKVTRSLRRIGSLVRKR